MNHFEKIRAALVENGLDAMLLTCRANRFYASGFDSHDTDGCALVTLDETYYWTDGRYIEAAGEQISDAKIALTDRANPYSKLISAVVAQHGIKKMGIDDAYMTVSEWRNYQKKLDCELLPASEMMTVLRSVKDAEELARMTTAQRIAEAALEEVKNDLRAGVSEKFIAARLIFLMLNGGAENVSFDPIVVSGKKTSMPHGVPSEKLIEEGDFVTMDFGSLYQGYCSDMTRTIAIGHATDEMQTVYETVLASQLAGIAAARAGVSGCAIDKASRDVIDAAGYGAYYTHSFGHSLGVEIHENPNAAASNERLMPAGAVISAEPGIYMAGKFGVRIEDVLILRENGCEVITKAPKDLLIL